MGRFLSLSAKEEDPSVEKSFLVLWLMRGIVSVFSNLLQIVAIVEKQSKTKRERERESHKSLLVIRESRVGEDE